MQDKNGNETRHFWAYEIIRKENGSLVGRYRELTKEQVEALRSQGKDLFAIPAQWQEPKEYHFDKK